MKSYIFKISGKVQGVYYRANVKNNANIFGYSGYVRNMPDGTVEAGVTCEEAQLNGFVGILKKGSKQSNVTSIKQIESKEVFNKEFEIR